MSPSTITVGLWRVQRERHARRRPAFAILHFTLARARISSPSAAFTHTTRPDAVLLPRAPRGAAAPRRRRARRRRLERRVSASPRVRGPLRAARARRRPDLFGARARAILWALMHRLERPPRPPRLPDAIPPRARRLTARPTRPPRSAAAAPRTTASTAGRSTRAPAGGRSLDCSAAPPLNQPFCQRTSSPATNANHSLQIRLSVPRHLPRLRHRRALRRVGRVCRLVRPLVRLFGGGCDLVLPFGFDPCVQSARALLPLLLNPPNSLTLNRPTHHPTHPPHPPATHNSYEVACRNAAFTDGYGASIERNDACRDESQSVVVKGVPRPPTSRRRPRAAPVRRSPPAAPPAAAVIDNCPCSYPGNAFSNKRWCCGDAGADAAHMVGLLERGHIFFILLFILLRRFCSVDLLRAALQRLEFSPLDRPPLHSHPTHHPP
jgi:hypothetical protein